MQRLLAGWLGWQAGWLGWLAAWLAGLAGWLQLAGCCWLAAVVSLKHSTLQEVGG